MILTIALGFSRTLRIVLLKNWNESATCCSSTKNTCEIMVVLGSPLALQVTNAAGMAPCIAGSMFSVIISVYFFPGTRPRGLVIYFLGLKGHGAHRPKVEAGKNGTQVLAIMLGKCFHQSHKIFSGDLHIFLIHFFHSNEFSL